MTNEVTQISDREREILRLVATGATNQQIADRLHISINTVKVHLRNIFGKIGATSRTEATMYAVRAGLVPVGQATLDAAPVEVVVADAPVETEATLETPSVPEIWAAEINERSVDLPIPAEVLPDGPATPAIIPQPARNWRLIGLGGALLVVLLGIGIYLAISRSAPSPPASNATPGVAVPDVGERWHELAPLPSGRSAFALASYTYEGKRYLYAIGGDAGDKASDQVVRYDVAANTWVPLSAKPTAVSEVQAVVIGGKIYVPGGRTAAGEISDQLESYDPQQDRWSTNKPLPAPRSGYSLAVVEGKLYLFGGWDGKTYRNEVWAYDPGQDAWAERKAMPTARAYAAATVIENAVYVVGGMNEQGSLAINERYIPAEDNQSGNPWAVKARLPGAVDHVAIASISDQLFVLGGQQNTNQLLIYTAGNDSWRADKLPLSASSDLRAQSIGNKLYIVGGRGESGATAQVYEYQAIYSVLLPAISN